jgi:hypothetical protein
VRSIRGDFAEFIQVGNRDRKRMPALKGGDIRRCVDCGSKVRWHLSKACFQHSNDRRRPLQSLALNPAFLEPLVHNARFFHVPPLQSLGPDCFPFGRIGKNQGQTTVLRSQTTIGFGLRDPFPPLDDTSIRVSSLACELPGDVHVH